MSSHVPGPLRAQGTALMAIDHGRWEPLARVVDKRLTPEAATQNAQHIAMCFNAHDELVAALKRIEMLGCTPVENGVMHTVESLSVIASYALAKVQP